MTDDDAFLAAFEDGTLLPEDWTHRAHVRVAYLYAARGDLNAAEFRAARAQRRNRLKDRQCAARVVGLCHERSAVPSSDR